LHCKYTLTGFTVWKFAIPVIARNISLKSIPASGDSVFHSKELRSIAVQIILGFFPVVALQIYFNRFYRVWKFAIPVIARNISLKSIPASGDSVFHSKELRSIAVQIILGFFPAVALQIYFNWFYRQVNCHSSDCSKH
jgi:uncharacterized membrane protein